MEALPIVLLFLYTWGFGFSLSRFVREAENAFEKNLIRVGLGLCIIPLVGILLSIFKIPVDWRIFLFLSVLYPLYYTLKNYKNFKLNLNFKIRKSDLSFLFIVFVFSLVFYMYHKGAFSYPYLEDDDSWSHALGAKYVAAKKTLFNPNGGIHYLDPYPPVYDAIMGLLHQTSSSLMWTLKFFNALLISLSIIFFYLFIKEFTDNTTLSIFSTATLAMLPSYLSHFIWAHALIPGFVFLSFYCLERIKYDKKWMYIAAVAISALILTTITHSLKFFFLFLVYFAVKCIIEKRFILEIFLAGTMGFLLSLIWWLPLAIRYNGIFGLLKRLGLTQDELSFSLSYLDSTYSYLILTALVLIVVAVFYFLSKRLTATQKSLLGPIAAVSVLVLYTIAYSTVYGVGTADRIYDFSDFFMARKQNMINNPIGIGIFAFLLFFTALFFILREQFSVVINKKKDIAKLEFYSLFFMLIFGLISLVISSISFFLFRFKPGTFLRQWTLRLPENYSYVYSFSFKVWGVYLFIVSLLFVAGIYTFLIYRDYISRKKLWVAVSLFWFTYVFAGLYDIPTQLFTFRLWTMLAFVLSIIVGYSFISILDAANKLGIPKIAVWIIFIALILFTSGIQKYTVNTAVWPPGGFWTSNEEIQGYILFKDNLPSETRVFTFSNNAVIIGMDKYTCHWCDDVREFQKNGFNSSAGETYNWLKARKYEYIVIDGQTVRKFGINETNNKLQSMLLFGKFSPVRQTQGFVLLKVA